MTTSINRIRVDGLHGSKKSFDIPIEENRLILVGENGAGKSTVANITYYLLTQQWHRLAQYRFQWVEIESDLGTVHFTYDEVTSLGERSKAPVARLLRRYYAPNSVRNLTEAMLQVPLFSEDEDEALVARLGAETDLPIHLVRQYVREYAAFQSPYTDPKRGRPTEMLRRLNDWNLGQFLYLPTYRRIEQDLKSIFQGLEIEEKIQEFRSKAKREAHTSFIELVEFGMEDVARTIRTRMEAIKEEVRSGLNNLTGSYLREVLRGLQEYPDLSQLRSMTSEDFDAMFARISDAFLPPEDKRSLKQRVAGISENPVEPVDKVIAHFLSKLVALYLQQKKNEAAVSDFVSVCNAYLTGKVMVYDSTTYEIRIEGESSAPSVDPDNTALRLGDLSSGEKQIISLFSHVYLSGMDRFFVIIDEPELSLSVLWQRRFLPDIVESGRCSGLIAVTHSPFVWDNSLERFVKPLAELVTR